MDKILHKSPRKGISNKKNAHSSNGKLTNAKHNVGAAIISSLEAIKEGNVIVIKQENLVEGIRKLLK